MFKKNEGMTDRGARIIIGTILLLLGVFVVEGTFGLILDVIGIIVVITGITGICMIYKIFGFSTMKENAPTTAAKPETTLPQES